MADKPKPDDCPICQEPGTRENPLCVVNCGSKPPHVFHRSCIKEYCNIKYPGQCPCPMCRAIINYTTCPGGGLGLALTLDRTLLRNDFIRKVGFGDLFVSAIDAMIKEGGIDQETLNMALFVSFSPLVLTLLLNAGANVNAVNDKGETALMLASMEISDIANFKIDWLIHNGADVNIASNAGMTALHFATYSYPYYIYNYSDFKKNTLLILKKVRYLIQAGANVNAANEEGRTPLMFAASKIKVGGDLIIRELIDNGARVSINAVSANGNTALMMAAYYANVENVQALIQKGAIIDVKNADGHNALYYTQPENFDASERYADRRRTIRSLILKELGYTHRCEEPKEYDRKERRMRMRSTRCKDIQCYDCYRRFGKPDHRDDRSRSRSRSRSPRRS